MSFKCENSQKPQIMFEFETYFKAIKREKYRNDTTDVNLFVQSINELALCSDYQSIYSKKLDRCRSYLFDQQSNPEFVIQFNNNYKALKSFEIIWFSPSGKLHFL